MRKVKIFQANKGADKAETDINTWLAQNPSVKITGTAGTNAYIVVFYET